MRAAVYGVLLASCAGSPVRPTAAPVVVASPAVPAAPAGVKPLWLRALGTPPYALGMAMSVDEWGGGVVIADTYLMSFSPAGALRWNRILESGASVDVAGDYVILSSAGRLASLDGAGVQQWVRAFDRPSSTRLEELVVDQNHDLVLLWRRHSDSSYQHLLTKYSREGDRTWQVDLIGAGLQDVTAVTVDPDNDLWVLGRRSDNDVLAEVTSQGGRGVVRVIPDHGQQSLTDVAGHPDGDLVLVGPLEGTGTAGLTIAKVAPDGTLRWARHLTEPASRGSFPPALAIDSLGNIVVAGASAIVSGYALVTKLGPGGDTLWTWTSARKLDSQTVLIGVDATGHVLVAGTFAAAGHPEAFLAKLPP